MTEQECSGVWEVCKSSHTRPGAIYYFNKASGDKVWEDEVDSLSKMKSTRQFKLGSPSLSLKSNKTEPKPQIEHGSSVKRKRTIAESVKKGPILVTPVRNIKDKPKSSATIENKISRNPVEVRTSSIKSTVRKSKNSDIKMSQLKKTIRNSPLKVNSIKSLSVESINCDPKASTSMGNTPNVRDSEEFNMIVNEPLSDMEIDYNFSDDEEGALNSDVEMTDIVDVVPKELKEAFHIVVDTNVLINHREFIDKLKEEHLQGCGPPKIIIPWVVLTELDLIKGNKDNSKSEELKFLAREATRYIREICKEKPISDLNCVSKEKKIIILKEIEFRDDLKQPGLDWSLNDDRIAYCCLHLQKKLDKDKVILLSNDMTFLNRASALGIRCFQPNELRDHIKFDSMQEDIFINSRTPYESSPNKKSTQDEIDSIMKITYRVILDGLSGYLGEKIKHSLGKDWERTIYRRPPWSLLDVLECLEKHWYSIFSFLLSQKFKNSTDAMLKMFSSSKGFICKKTDALQFINHANVLFFEITKVDGRNLSTYQNRLTELQQEISAIQGGVESQNTPVSQFSIAFSPLRRRFEKSNMVILGDRKVQHYLHFLWCIFQRNTGLVLDSLDYRHSCIYEKPQVLPSRKETFDYLPKFFPMVRVIRESLRKILYKGEEFTDLDTVKCIKTLHQQLKCAPTILDLKTDVPVLPELSELEAFCINDEYRAVIIDAYNEVDEKLKTLHDCIRNLKYDETY